MAFFEQEKWDEALAAFRAAAEKDPEMSEAWYTIRAMLEYVRLSGDPDGSGKAHAAALLEKKAGRAAKPDAEAQARSPPPLVAPAPRLRATSCG